MKFSEVNTKYLITGSGGGGGYIRFMFVCRGSLICRCRRKNHAYTHTTITVPWEKARRRQGSKSAIGEKGA